MTAGAALVFLTLPASHGGEEPMKYRANGTFEIQLKPVPGEDKAGLGFPRMTSEKQFHGDLEGTSRGEMMSVEGTTAGSRAYAALERVSGSLNGRKGSFALVHSGTMRRGGELSMIIRVVPDSGTGQLVGISGTFEIVLENGKHSYHFDYELPDAA